MSEDEELYVLGKQLREIIERLVIFKGLGCARNEINQLLTGIEVERPVPQLIQCPHRGCAVITNRKVQELRTTHTKNEWTCYNCDHSFPPAKWLWLQPGPVPEDIEET